MATIPETRPVDRPRPYVEDPMYPSSDGFPMGESHLHWIALSYLFGAIQEAFRDRPDVLVAGDMFIYFVEGQPMRSRAPDCMVVFGVGNHPRPCFKTWEEKAIPAAVFEIVSKNSILNDTAVKPRVYEEIGIPEYYLFDPEGESLDQPFLAFHLERGQYEPMPRDPEGGVTSATLGLRFLPQENLLRVFDARTGQAILSNDEKVELLDDQAEALKEETERADIQARRAEQEAGRAEEESRRADALAAEVQRLRARLDESDRNGKTQSS